MSARHHLVTGQLENISWQVLEQYRDVIKEMIKGKSGIYALYNRDKLYYVGLASNLMKRLNQHLKDRHGRKIIGSFNGSQKIIAGRLNDKTDVSQGYPEGF